MIIPLLKVFKGITTITMRTPKCTRAARTTLRAKDTQA
jgi:hypothetical protein